jgi:hypothetical protein
MHAHLERAGAQNLLFRDANAIVKFLLAICRHASGAGVTALMMSGASTRSSDDGLHPASKPGHHDDRWMVLLPPIRASPYGASVEPA